MLDLRSYQEEAVRFLTERTVAYLADDPGLGKTITVLEAAKRLNASKVAVVCPKAVLSHWHDEIIKHGHFQNANIAKSFPQIPTVQVVNYEQIHKCVGVFANADVFVIDECHYTKNEGNTNGGKHYTGVRRSAYTRSIARFVIENNGRVYALSGTPMPKGQPVELIHQLEILGAFDPLFDSWEHYVRRYCAAYRERIYTKYGPKVIWNVKGASNLEELQQVLSPLMLRRTRREALPGIATLPPDIRPVHLSQTQRQAYYEIIDNIKEWIYEKVRSREYATEDEAIEAAIRAFNGGQLVIYNELRQFLATVKLAPTIDFVTDFLSTGRSLVVYGYHREFLTLVAETFNTEPLIGGISEGSRSTLIHNFQNGKSQLLVAGMKVAGIGINLAYNCSDALFAEYDWTAAEHKQALERLTRTPQQNPVANYWLCVADTLDAQLVERIALQATVAGTVLGDNLTQDVLVSLGIKDVFSNQ